MSANRANAPYYFVPGPSRHPITAAFGLLMVGGGAAGWVNGQSWAPYLFAVGLVWFLFVLRAWFADAIGESEGASTARTSTYRSAGRWAGSSSPR